MSKSPEEIKRALQICSKYSTGICRRKKCPYFNPQDPVGTDCLKNMAADALKYIQQLEGGGEDDQ